ncbi:hypothetical protein K9N68_15265 [Kovacikia minuta CCNUW1]|uniref:hypothetical protein n=1 Tax=Kovacikia minuta TaxID=2931930 RepID=UPI001CC9452F|nr:hypothetical protein [Kovacikia minuta]UBF29070.1 hypothetical protein K9N68_15265 [Kovacikia minuta CCNUW1]
MTQADREAVMGAIATIKQKLSLLVDLTPEKRKSNVQFPVDLKIPLGRKDVVPALEIPYIFCNPAA